MYKLAIAIPTYNRKELLAPLLEAFLGHEVSEEIQVVVSDNASTDGTEEMCGDYMRHHPNLKYFRLPTNMGMDRNYLSAAEHTDAEYCWFFGSDDIPCLGAVERVLEMLRSEGPDILLFDRVWCDYSLNPVRVDHYLSSSAQSTFDTSQESQLLRYLDHSSRLCALFSYLSSIVVSKSRWDSTPAMEEFVGSAYVHTAKLLHILGEGARLSYVPEPLVLCRGDNETLMERGLFGRARLDLDGYLRLIERFLATDSLRSAAQRVIRREYPFLRLLLLMAYSKGRESVQLMSYVRAFEYQLVVRVVIGGLAFCPPLRWAMRMVAPPMRSIWWRQERRALSEVPCVS